MKHGSLFSGIGGFDLAAEWMGWDNVFHCEWNEFGQKILKHYWPDATSYTDITKTDFNVHRGTIDILTGGFPCQPYSLAGKRKGKEDDRHLWPEMLRAVREIRPRWVVGENVFGLINWSDGLVFHEVQTDLEAEGYEVFPYVLPACAVNAPHRRDRVWFVAYANGIRNNRMYKSEGSNNEGKLTTSTEQSGNGRTGEIKRHGKSGATTNTNGTGWEKFDITTKSTEKKLNSRYAMHTDSTGSKGEYFGQTRERKLDGPDSRIRVSTWENFPTQSPICNGDDGIPSRLDGITFPKWRDESIKVGGNAIVPQVALQIFKAIEQFEINEAQSKGR